MQTHFASGNSINQSVTRIVILPWRELFPFKFTLDFINSKSIFLVIPLSFSVRKTNWTSSPSHPFWNSNHPSQSSSPALAWKARGESLSTTGYLFLERNYLPLLTCWHYFRLDLSKSPVRSQPLTVWQMSIDCMYQIGFLLEKYTLTSTSSPSIESYLSNSRN